MHGIETKTISCLEMMKRVSVYEIPLMHIYFPASIMTEKLPRSLHGLHAYKLNKKIEKIMEKMNSILLERGLMYTKITVLTNRMISPIS